MSDLSERGGGVEDTVAELRKSNVHSNVMFAWGGYVSVFFSFSFLFEQGIYVLKYNRLYITMQPRDHSKP